MHCKYSLLLLLIGLHITKVALVWSSCRHGDDTIEWPGIVRGDMLMNRSLKLSMLIALALGSSQVLALDLGQVQVKSSLGQPLLAEIPLHPANPAELQNLSVQLASSEDFARAGITGGRTTIPLHFSVATTDDGQKVIRITSNVAVDDPYLDLLLEVNGKAGKSVREFAILLDPPGAATPPAALAATTARQATPSRAASTAAASAPRQHHGVPVPRAEAAPATVSNGKYGPVERGQTLSSIARDAKPTGVDLNQMLLALKQANPDAFYRDNINALKTGAVLRVPTSAEAQAMTAAAALAAVHRENSDWRAGTPGKPTTVADAATRSSASSAPTGTSSSSDDRLALVPAKDVNGAGASGGSVGGTGGKSANDLRQDLLRSQESVASLQQQGNDLKTRLKDLTDINGKNEHLLSLKDTEIAELQSQLATARKSAGMPALAAVGVAPAATVALSETKPASAASVPAKPVATAPAGSQSAPSASPPAATGSVAGTAAVAASSVATTASPAAATMASVAGVSPAASAAVARPAPVKPLIKPVIKQNTVPADEQPWYMRTWAWAIGAIVILLLLGTLFRRRKVAVASLPKSSSSLADRFESTSPVAGHDDSDDVEQNELLDELAEHPDDIHLHLELVTLYYSRRDVERFEAAAEAMHAHITDPQQDEWQDVVHMGEDLAPGHPLFDQNAASPAHEETEAHHDFDIDDYAADNHASTAVSSMPPLPPQVPKKVSGYNFNFDLTPAHAAAEPVSDMAAVPPLLVDTQHEATPATHAESASSWHFDDAENDHQLGSKEHDMGEFNDDPVDTKLDLARAYLDMGDSDGARAMLGEVLKEGSQMQQDVAKRLLETLH